MSIFLFGFKTLLYPSRSFPHFFSIVSPGVPFSHHGDNLIRECEFNNNKPCLSLRRLVNRPGRCKFRSHQIISFALDLGKALTCTRKSTHKRRHAHFIQVLLRAWSARGWVAQVSAEPWWWGGGGGREEGQRCLRLSHILLSQGWCWGGSSEDYGSATALDEHYSWRQLGCPPRCRYLRSVMGSMIKIWDLKKDF